MLLYELPIKFRPSHLQNKKCINLTQKNISLRTFFFELPQCLLNRFISWNIFLFLYSQPQCEGSNKLQNFEIRSKQMKQKYNKIHAFYCVFHSNAYELWRTAGQLDCHHHHWCTVRLLSLRRQIAVIVIINLKPDIYIKYDSWICKLILNNLVRSVVICLFNQCICIYVM